MKYSFENDITKDLESTGSDQMPGSDESQGFKIITAYSPETDMTFILEDSAKMTRVVGFYYGEPDEEATKEFNGRLIAEYD